METRENSDVKLLEEVVSSLTTLSEIPPKKTEILFQRNKIHLNQAMYSIRHPIVKANEEGEKGNVGNLGTLGQLFFTVDGVVAVKLRPYKIVLEKAEVFDWHEIRPQVERILMVFVASVKRLHSDFALVAVERKVDGVLAAELQEARPAKLVQRPRTPKPRT